MRAGALGAYGVCMTACRSRWRLAAGAGVAVPLMGMALGSGAVLAGIVGLSGFTHDGGGDGMSLPTGSPGWVNWAASVSKGLLTRSPHDR